MNTQTVIEHIIGPLIAAVITGTFHLIASRNRSSLTWHLKTEQKVPKTSKPRQPRPSPKPSPARKLAWSVALFAVSMILTAVGIHYYADGTFSSFYAAKAAEGFGGIPIREYRGWYDITLAEKIWVIAQPASLMGSLLAFGTAFNSSPSQSTSSIK